MEYVKEGVREAGGVPFEFNTMAICDGIAMNHDGMRYSLASREIVVSTVESMAKGHSVDGLVMIPSCDKVVPGMLMAAGRLDIPSIVLTGGPMKPSSYKDKNADLITVFEAVGELSSGKITEEELDELERIAAQIHEESLCLHLSDLAVNGKDLMALGYSGSGIGEGLKFLLDAVIEDKVPNSKVDLLEFIRSHHTTNT